MSVALGVHVGTDEISAVLVETDLPGLGPVTSRPVSIAAAPGGIGDAVATVLGIMRVQAAQRDLIVDGAAVVCDNLLHGEIVRAALADHRVVEVLAMDDPRLPDEYPLDVAAAVVGAASRTGRPPGDEIAAGQPGLDDRAGEFDAASRGSRWTMVGLGVAVLAALSGATVWAFSSPAPTQDAVLDTADSSIAPSVPGRPASSAGPVVPVAGPSAVPPIGAGVLDVSTAGSGSGGIWIDAFPAAAPSATSNAPSSSSTGRENSGGGNSAPGGRDTKTEISKPETETPPTDDETTAPTDTNVPDPTEPGPTEPTEPTEPAEPTGPTEPVEPAEPSGPTDPEPAPRTEEPPVTDPAE
ncbi:hypothetical protein CH252_00445 [Rhodococcus sp. 06-1477-1B]|uniref:hypothetical protein n=1 Tax=Rhodococcus sp. 06-1474-1B TaxID=2022499 RepID=UPI000BDA3FBA|nr:hypothetical protein [Rhodococcus sp. 06-1474-1B]OZD44302.1 hypothetical protein CH266_23945 [Rhodococcus sp. 06-1474-1B]OZD59411.1 hypothetical protein CH252_00445 [Rhodococcus sp. 06-1477-1B]